MYEKIIITIILNPIQSDTEPPNSIFLVILVHGIVAKDKASLYIGVVINNLQ